MVTLSIAQIATTKKVRSKSHQWNILHSSCNWKQVFLFLRKNGEGEEHFWTNKHHLKAADHQRLQKEFQKSPSCISAYDLSCVKLGLLVQPWIKVRVLKSSSRVTLWNITKNQTPSKHIALIKANKKKGRKHWTWYSRAISRTLLSLQVIQWWMQLTAAQLPWEVSDTLTLV